jgi:hypothetical protein
MDKTPISFQEKNGNTRLIVHPSTKETGKWQVSGFAKDVDGRVTAQGDSVFPTKEAAVASVPKDKFVPEVAKKRTSESGAVNPQGSNEERFGISAKANIEMGRDIEPGEGSSPEELVHRGRELLASGVDPKKALKQALKNKNPLSDAISVTRAHGEALYKAASEAADKHGIDSPEYKAAALADSEWARKTQPLRTEAGEAMRAIQGTTDIDTGTFHGVNRAFTELMASKGKDTEMTPAQKEFAKKTTDEVKAAEERIKQASLLVFKQLYEQAEAPKPQQTKVLPPTPLYRSRPSERGAVEHDLRDPVAKRAETLRVWNHVKANYLDKGAQDFDDVINGTAIDLGMTRDAVRQLLTASPKTKQITNEMYLAMAKKRQTKLAIEIWLHEQTMNGLQKTAEAIPRYFFVAKILGHGTVAPGTHAAVNYFDPTAWTRFYLSHRQMYKMVFSTVNHEQWVQDHVRTMSNDVNPATGKTYNMYEFALRCGVKCDVNKFADDYQNATIKTAHAKANMLIGGYGYDMLKDFRLRRFQQLWEKAPSALKETEEGRMNVDYGKSLAIDVNHATGIINTQLKNGPLATLARQGFFAAKLEGSRWAWAVGDPAKVTAYMYKWVNGKASPAEIDFIKRQVMTKGSIVATYAALLAMNQGFLTGTGSKEKINGIPEFMGGQGIHPLKSDIGAMKVAGLSVSPLSPMFGMVKLFARIYNDLANQKPGENPLKEVGGHLAEYGRGKLSPFAGFLTDIATKHTANGDVVPGFTGIKPDKYHKQESFLEYGANTFLPIPIEEGLKNQPIDELKKSLLDVWEGAGMTKEQQELWLNMLKHLGTTAIPAGVTGFRIAPDYGLEPQDVKENKPPAFKPPTLGKGFKKYSENDIIQRNGKNYTVVGFDHDGQPMVEEV